MEHYYSLSNYLKNEYGEKLYKLSLDSGCTCPNRDGFVSFGGCIFCSEGGSGDFAEKITLETVDESLERAKKRVSKKTNNCNYIAYFQSFTNTYGDISYLKRLYTEVARREDIKIISIATRPDCLGDSVLEMLQDLSQIIPVWVELGLQTTNPDTAKYIRRGYENQVYFDAVEKLNALGIKVITHVIIGLPNETKEDVFKTVSDSISAGTWGLKLQLLHVLKGTALALDYEKGLFKTLEMDEYIDLLCELLRIIPKDVVIHRLTGDGPKNLLVAPVWSSNKKNVLNQLNKALENSTFC